MKKIVKFSKSYGNILNIKNDFYNNNDSNLKNSLKIIGEYWFGTDIPDLFRSLVCSRNILDKKVYFNQLNHKFTRFVDELQSVLDKNKVCSEVHLIFKK